MKQEVNARKFEKDDPEFVEFFNEHGWVVLKGNLTSDVIQGGLGQWANLKQRYAHEMGLSLVEYENEVSQWRNLWHNEKGYFRDLIYTPSMNVHGEHGWEGARLLHDHIICKPHKGHNDKILASGLHVLASKFSRGIHMDALPGCDAQRWMFGSGGQKPLGRVFITRRFHGERKG